MNQKEVPLPDGPSSKWKNSFYHICPPPILQTSFGRRKMTYQSHHNLLHMEKLKPRERRMNLPKPHSEPVITKVYSSGLLQSGWWNCHRSSQGVISSSFLARSEEPGLPSPQTRAGSRTDRFRRRDPFSSTQCFYYMCPLPKTALIPGYS